LNMSRPRCARPTSQAVAGWVSPLRAADGDRDAVDQLVELAGERGDMGELRRLADAGSTDAVDELVQLAGEREDTDELRRLAAAGSRDAADVLAEIADEEQR
jgi:hypothetical protein